MDYIQKTSQACKFCDEYGSSDKYKHVTHPQHSRYVDYGGFHVLLRVSFFRFWNYARFYASKDCDDEDVDWEHEETALHAHHEVLPGHLY